MKFTTSSLLTFATLVLSTPLVERQSGSVASQNQAVQACKSKFGELYCCAEQQNVNPHNQPSGSPLGSLLDLLNLSNLIGGGLNVPVGLSCNPIALTINAALCSQKAVCCNAAPAAPVQQNNNGFNVLPIAGPLINVQNVCLAII